MWLTININPPTPGVCFVARKAETNGANGYCNFYIPTENKSFAPDSLIEILIENGYVEWFELPK